MQQQGPAGAHGRGMAHLARTAGQLRQGAARRTVTDTARRVRRRAATLAQVDGVASRVTILGMAADTLLRRELDQPPAATAVPVSAGEISGRPLWLRPRSRDRAALEFVRGRHHLPPPELVDPPRHIAVFGANIGLLTAELAMLYPQARLLGVEPESQNAVLARRNLAHLGDRVHVVEKAVWWRDDRLDVAWGRDAWGLDLRGAAPGQVAATARTVDAVGAGTLIAGLTGGAQLDYLLVSIGSAWLELLTHGEWTADVRCIKIEIKERGDDAVSLLRELGYRARSERVPWGAVAVGIRP